jgi:hypothetical protein
MFVIELQEMTNEKVRVTVICENVEMEGTRGPFEKNLYRSEDGIQI